MTCSMISLQSIGYDAGYVKDNFGCIKSPCECAGIGFKDKTVIGMDFKSDLRLWAIYKAK